MGAHHFHMDLVPIGTSLANKTDDDEEWPLSNYVIPEAVLAKLRTLLPVPNHWGDVEEFVATNDWGSDIRIWHEDGKVVAVGFRYAPVIDAVALLHSFVELAKEANCDLLIRSPRQVVPAKFESVFEILRNHRAFRFLSDPEDAIREAANEIKAQQE